MSNIGRYQAYAEAFEESYADDDWSRLEQYFTEDAVYKTDVQPMAFRAEGRAAVLAKLKEGVDSFDRNFDSRALEMLAEPEDRGGNVFMQWAATYKKAGLPDVRLTGTETATFEGDRISQLEDTFEEEAVQGMLAWMQEHGAALAGG